MKLFSDDYVDRSTSYSAKWLSTYDNPNIVSMSVADMDLSSPLPLIEQLKKQAEIGVYGYTVLPRNYHEIVKNYISRHYNYDVSNEYIVFCPRIIQAISIYIREFTASTDRIGTFIPSYSNILNIILNNKRVLEFCELDYQDGNYSINFEELEKCFQKISTFVLISPHNPTGIVWSIEELQKIAALAEKYKVFIISDDIHADFDFSGHKHIMISALNKYVEFHSMICTSPTKTFNIPGLEISNIIIVNEEVREKFKRCMLELGLHNPNFFSIPALMSAYQFCDNWIEQLNAYILENKKLVTDFFIREIPELEITKTQGTFLLWINYEKLKIDERKLKHWFIELSEIEVSWGSDFFTDKPFFRMNIALPKYLLQTSLYRIKHGLMLLRKEDRYYE